MESLITRQALSVLKVMSWPGVGVAKTRAVLRALGPGQDIIELARASLLLNVPRVADAPVGVRDRAQETAERCSELGVSIVSMVDDEYPALLKGIADAPPLLFVRGSLASLQARSVAVVGTREASDAGRRIAFAIAEHLAQRNYSVVSGLALGIDTAAHNGALAGKGLTVAILAHGLDTVAPTSNRPLAERILDNGGALVAEHPPGTPPRPPEFARRNRIQSGLSLMSVIVESAAEGGAMIQAQFTHDQGRILAAVVSEQGEHNRGGADRLVREFGATLIRRISDIDTVLDGATPRGELRGQGGSSQLEFEW
jgi:DNA processing protein